MFQINGYRPSREKLNCPTFSSASNFTKLATSVGTDYIIPEYTPISNQGSIGSCAANATADAFEIIKGLEDPNTVEQVSRLFIYYNARAAEKTTTSDVGCYIHDALDSLTKLGVCREVTWQYDTANVFTHPTIEAYREGNDNTINTFYQITSSGDARVTDVEKAVRLNHPVIFGTQVGQELLDYTGAEKVFNPPTSFVGGHAMLIVGVRLNLNGTRDFYIRNSWGSAWGTDGHCWFSEDYIKWSSTNDLFVPTRMENFAI